jgi:hypothetical protein
MLSRASLFILILLAGHALAADYSRPVDTFDAPYPYDPPPNNISGQSIYTYGYPANRARYYHRQRDYYYPYDRQRPYLRSDDRPYRNLRPGRR